MGGGGGGGAASESMVEQSRGSMGQWNKKECYGSGVRPVHLLRVFLLRVLESNFAGDPL